MKDDDFNELVKKMTKERLAQVELKNPLPDDDYKFPIKIKRLPNVYSTIKLDFDFHQPCDYDRGGWYAKVYHVVFDGRGTPTTLCGRSIWRKKLWVAYLSIGSNLAPPHSRRVCKQCEAHPDYILHTLALI